MACSHFKLLATFGGLAAMALAFSADTADAQRANVRPTQPRVAATSQPANTEIVPPPALAISAPAGTVILKAGSSSNTLRTLHVKRQIPIATLRAQPIIALGKSKVDMSPVLKSATSPINLAARLRGLPALAQVVADDIQVMEVDQGLIVRQYVSYRLKPGACADAGKRTQVERGGAFCFARTSTAARNAAFANPKDPRYIADPGKRAKAAAEAAAAADKDMKEFASGIAEFLAMMKDPIKRAEVEAELGAGEAARLNALSDDALEEELVNAAETEIEDIMFVPTLDKLDASPLKGIQRVTPKVPKLPEKVDVEHTLQSHVMLTGFTLGRQNEWSHRVSVTIKMCAVSCKKTYYLELYAGFSYGFGLRFPIRTGGLYAYHREGDTVTASVAPVFQPVDGSTADYAAAGLSGDKIFDGQELVAEVGAKAGLRYKVPFHSGDVSASVGVDFTKDLPTPFANGQFTPPAPGPANALNKEVIFDNPDLIGGLANYGFVGAKILPAFKVGLSSSRLRLILIDNLDPHGKKIEMESSGKPYPLIVNSKDQSSSFSIGDPQYTLAFSATPGLAARLFVDVAVWSHHWDWPVWFPGVEIKLPPDGYTFTCHEGTVCMRDYRYSPTVAEESAERPYNGENDKIGLLVVDWKRDLVRRHTRKCPNQKIHVCEVAVRGMIDGLGNVMEVELRKPEMKYPSKDTTVLIFKKTEEAGKKAKEIILDCKVAEIGDYGKTLFAAYEPVWNHDCTDQLCRDRIHALGTPFVQALRARQKSSPALSRDEVVAAENAQGRWEQKARTEVLSSLLRARKTTTIRLPGRR